MLKEKDDKTERLELASRIREAINSIGRGGKVRVSEACGITPQAITGWLSTGKIDKDHIAIVSEITGYRLHWLITGHGVKTEKEYAEIIQHKRIAVEPVIEKKHQLTPSIKSKGETRLNESALASDAEALADLPEEAKKLIHDLINLSSSGDIDKKSIEILQIMTDKLKK